MYKWLSNSAEVPLESKWCNLLHGCFKPLERAVTHTETGKNRFVSQEHKRHMLTKKIVAENRISTHKLGLTQLQPLQLTIEGAIQSKSLSLALRKC